MLKMLLEIGFELGSLLKSVLLEIFVLITQRLKFFLFFIFFSPIGADGNSQGGLRECPSLPCQ